MPQPHPESPKERLLALIKKAATGGSSGGNGYDAHKERARARQARLAREGQDIGPIPKPKNMKRRKSCERNFPRFCEKYFPRRFALAWAPDHLKVLALVVRVVIEGLLFALAMPRGSGKTSIFEVAALWAVLYGHRRFVVLIGAGKDHAEELLDSIMTELECNELLHEDFPEVTVPVRALEGMRNKVKGQRTEGHRTRMYWKNHRFIFPTIDREQCPWAQCSGAIIHTVGILGRVRGIKCTLEDGTVIRPDLLLVDDPQTEGSATSDLHVKRRIRVLNGDLLGMKGPSGKSIAALAAVTVVARGDMADQLLDREKCPDWNGSRISMVKKFPTNEKLIDEYARVRADGLRMEDGGAAANAFWKKHRKKLEEGAEVYWPQRFDDGEVSAVQHAINLRLRDEAAFWAEYQNEPLDDAADDSEALTIDIIEGKIAGVQRGVIPVKATHLTSFIDVQRKILVWMTVAWWEGFGGHVVDYGTWPDQGTHHWTRRGAKRTMARQLPGAGLEAQAYHALNELVGEILSRQWQFESGAPLGHSRLLIDSGEGLLTDVVYQFCRESPHKDVLLPSKGRGVGPTETPISEWKRTPGVQLGTQWRIGSGARHTRLVTFDANFWKSFVAGRLRVPYGDTPAISICTAPRKQSSAVVHRVLTEHLTAEYAETAKSKGRAVNIWKERPNRDNDLFDCLVGCAVGASIAGVTTTGHAPAKKKRKRITLSELQGRRR